MMFQQHETCVDANGNLLAQGEPALTAYDDGSGVWTIGWGHTAGMQPGDVITRAQAEQFFLDDLNNIVEPQLTEIATVHAAAEFLMT